MIGTPLSHTYPKENAELQRKIASEYLTVSQVPVRRYELEKPPVLPRTQHHHVGACHPLGGRRHIFQERPVSIFPVRPAVRT